MGYMMPLGKGSATSFSVKNNINGKISTKYGIMGVDDAIPNIFWLDYLLMHKVTWSTKTNLSNIKRTPFYCKIMANYPAPGG